MKRHRHPIFTNVIKLAFCLCLLSLAPLASRYPAQRRRLAADARLSGCSRSRESVSRAQ